jgi:large subunit ribosomal protein L10
MNRRQQVPSGLMILSPAEVEAGKFRKVLQTAASAVRGGFYHCRRCEKACRLLRKRRCQYMAVIRSEKEAQVTKIKEYLATAKGAVLADYRGITVAQDTDLRRKAREAGVQYRVFKNTLTQIAAKEAGIAGLDKYLEGLTVMAWSATDAVAPAKLLSDFIKDNKLKSYEIKAGILDGRAIDANGVKQLASLPPREVLIAKLLGSMQAPVSGLVNVLQGGIRKFVYALNAIKERKESA